MKFVNIGVLAHVDAGKTSLTERLLFNAGVIDRSAESTAAARKRIRLLWK